MKIASQFVCHMYGQRKISDLNEARYNKLMQLTGKVQLDKPLANIKRVDCALLPPCLRTLEMKVLRARYMLQLYGHMPEQLHLVVKCHQKIMDGV